MQHVRVLLNKPAAGLCNLQPIFTCPISNVWMNEYVYARAKFFWSYLLSHECGIYHLVLRFAWSKFLRVCKKIHPNCNERIAQNIHEDNLNAVCIFVNIYTFCCFVLIFAISFRVLFKWISLCSPSRSVICADLVGMNLAFICCGCACNLNTNCKNEQNTLFRNETK